MALTGSLAFPLPKHEWARPAEWEPMFCLAWEPLIAADRPGGDYLGLGFHMCPPWAGRKDQSE